MTSARRIAYQLLTQVRKGRRIDRALDAAKPSPTDRPWVQELTYGVERLRGRLDHVLEHHLERGLASLPGPVRIHLEMGVYQLLYMGSVPSYAAVSQSVAGVRAMVGDGMARLTNAVLRRVASIDEVRDLFPDPVDDAAGYLSTWGSHPRWVVERWIERLGESTATKIVEANNRVPEVIIRPFSGTSEYAIQTLADIGISARAVEAAPRCIAIDPARRVAEALEAIRGYAQDPAAAQVADFCGFEPDTRVVDLCAAPGGKALALASVGCDVVAIDRSYARAGLIQETAQRLGAPVHACVADAAAAPVVAAPAILLDAPCTGSGTLRRHPDARWRLSWAALESLRAVQASLLDAAAERVSPGGTLVYATCSLENEENQEQVERFLARHREFSLELPPQAQTDAAEVGRTPQGILCLLPTDTGYDGAFAARMTRIR